MRLAYLAYGRLPTNRAYGYQMTKMCSAFAAAGLDVTLVHPRYHAQPQGPAEALFSYYDVPPGLFAQYPFPTFSSRFRLLHGGHAVFWATLLSIIREHRRYVAAHLAAGDIVYTRDLRNLGALADLRDRLGLKLVCELHDLPRRNLKRRVAALARADLVVPISGALRDAYLAHGLPPDRVQVEHDAFDATEFAAPPTQAEARRQLGLGEGLVIGYLGTFSYVAGGKGVETLIEALAQLPDLDDVTLHLIGSRRPESEAGPLLDQAAALGIAPHRLAIHGRIGRAEVPVWLAACDICAHALPDSAFNRQASPLKIFEYMAASRAIVATDLAGMAEVLRHEANALLVPPGDPAALAAAFRRLHDDPGLAQRLATRARQDVEHYTWEHRVERILARL